MQASVDIIRGLSYVLRSRGISTEAFLREAGIEPSVFDVAQAKVDLAVMARAATAAYRLTRDPALALHVGLTGPTQMLSVAGDLVMRVPTIRAAISEINTYFPLVLPAHRFTLIEQGERAHLTYSPPFADDQGQRFATEFAFAFMVRVGRNFTGESPIELRVRHVAPIHAAEYPRLLDCPVHFGAARNEIIFRRATLDVPQPFADTAVWQLLKGHAHEILTAKPVREPLHERVRQVLLHEGDLHDPQWCNLSVRMNMNAADLRARLNEEGHSLWSLVDSVRREVALKELAKSELAIKEIAERVGFSDPSVFHRAFKRWTNITPGRYRVQTALERAS